MTIYNSIVVALWIVFLLYWLVSAIGVKRTAKSSGWWRGAAVRALIVAALVVALRLQLLRILVTQSARELAAVAPYFAPAGTALCALGLIFAAWARVHLGRNWGYPMSLKEQPELVTSGPYAFVRHPMYTGILFAMLGSFFVEGVLWLILLAVFGVYFVYSATVEDRLMSHQFPNDYPAYKKRTKLLIPFLL
jgi:protein-S-isoprenylcysteine O-methyltransferase Ste14